MPTDVTLHIHRNPSDPCIACGDADDGQRVFLTDPGQWNQEARNCSPSTVIRPDYTIAEGRDIRTSALKGERLPDRRKVSDPR